MKKNILLIIIFLSQGIMSWGQSDTLSYESIMGYYKSKTNMIEFYQMAGNNDKAAELTKERNEYIDALGNNYGKGRFYYTLSELYYEASNYQSAIRTCNKAIEIIKFVLGLEHPDYAKSLLLLASMYSDISDYSEAIRLGTEAMEIYKRVWGTDHLDYALSLLNLALNQNYQGHYSEAVRLGNDAIDIFRRKLGTEHPGYASALENLALFNSGLGNYSESIRLGTEALKIYKEKLGTNNPNCARLLNDLANYYHYIGNYSEAIRLGTESLSVLGINHPNYTSSLSNLAMYYADYGNYSKAIGLLTEAIAITKNIYGVEHINYARSLNILAYIYSALGNYSEAIRVGTEALKIKKIILGEDHPDYAASLSDLSLYHSYIGDYPMAINLVTDALEITKKYGINHPDYGKYLANLAMYNLKLGNYSETIRVGEESIAILKEVFGTSNPDYSKALDIVAAGYSSLGNYSEAVRLGREVLDIKKEVFGAKHLEFVRSLSNVACYYYEIGNYSEASRIGKEAMEIRKETLGLEHPEYAASLNNQANYIIAIGNYTEGLRMFMQALEISKNNVGIENQLCFNILYNISLSNFKLGNYSLGYDYLKQAIDVSQAYILRSFSELSSGLQESLWLSRYSSCFNTFLPSTVYRQQTKESVSELYDKTTLFAKGILLNSSVGMRKLILESGDSRLVAKYDALATNKSVYDKQLEKPIKKRFIDMDSLRSVIQRQEMELARDSKTYGDFARNLRIKWQDVQQRLGKNDLAIEFLDFPLYGTDSTMYAALTLKQGYDYPHMITLFEKRQLKSISEDNYYTNTDLYNLIWKPLEEELSGVENVYFSPSGDLHRIGIEYIPVTMTENICDKFNLHRLSSTRQLAYIQAETQGDKSVLYGGLKYDAAVSDTISASPSTRENRGFTFVPRAIVDSLDIRGSYKYLPGTKEEADHIVSYLNTHSIPYKYYYGAAGTEESFKGLDGSKPKTLHIATHGFYMTEQDAERKNFARPLLLEEGRAYHEDKPMTRSGLLLSGCSRALNHENIPDGIEDGILTADEISKLDLRGLDLVVLSACQTALGDITSGEGVFGLQRGFKNAGAKTIIMSLWNVSDFATQHLMTSFYNHYLSGMPKEQSFSMAQKELRELIGPGQDKPDWAAFVMLDGI